MNDLREMTILQRVLKHPLFQKRIHEIAEEEENRVFCRHDIEHSLAVARIMYIHNLEDGNGYTRDLIYCTAFLHDIGRGKTDHAAAGAVLAEKILTECRADSVFPMEKILNAIRMHGSRSAENDPPQDLTELLYRADKESRPCYGCKAQDRCNWSVRGRNMNMEIRI